jgi:carbon monoxide dehydrogenase subunit G
MDLEHTFTVPASVEETWSAFQDIESVAGCFPGATVTEVDGDDFKGSAKVKLGPIALTYNGTGHFVEKDEAAHRFVVEAKGKDKRGNGTAGATVTATLTGEGDSTRVDVATDLSITGKPAQFGRGVIQDVSDKLLQQFVDCLQTKVGAADDVPTPADEPPATDAGARSSSGGDRAPEPPTQDEPSRPQGAGEPAAAATPLASATTTAGASARGSSQDDALDLGGTLLPVLAKAYWKQAVGVVLALLVLRRLVRAVRR